MNVHIAYSYDSGVTEQRPTEKGRPTCPAAFPWEKKQTVARFVWSDLLSGTAQRIRIWGLTSFVFFPIDFFGPEGSLRVTAASLIRDV